MTKKKTEDVKVEPGETATLPSGRKVTNTSAEPMHVAEITAVDVPGHDALSALGRAELERTGVMPSTAIEPEPSFLGNAPGLLTDEQRAEYRLRLTVDLLLDMQHSRAAAGRGTSIPWQNARAHITKAIECIEQQSAADASK